MLQSISNAKRYTSYSDDELLATLLKTPSVVESICNWNAARYEQVHSEELTLALLHEELFETREAYSKYDAVATLDGLGDLFYVAIGALWKTGLSAANITQLMTQVEEDTAIWPTPEVAVFWYEATRDANVLCLVAHTALQRMHEVLGSDTYVMNVIRAICTSNDTKDVVRTGKHEKANKVKGAGYIPPTEVITELLCRATAEAQSGQ